MSGFYLVQKIRKLEYECDKLGLVMCSSRYGTVNGKIDCVAVRPKDRDSLPIFARDAEMFVGTLDQLEYWIEGVRWARNYDRMLMGNNIDTKRERKEQDYRNKQLVRALKQEELTVDK